jgi:hypothetical protein
MARAGHALAEMHQRLSHSTNTAWNYPRRTFHPGSPSEN